MRFNRRFFVGVAAYVLVVLGMLALSNVFGGELVFAAEIATVPVGILWFMGGLSVLIVMGSLLGPAGPILLYGAFAATAVLNAIVVCAAASAVGRRRGRAARYRNRPSRTEANRSANGS